MVSATNPENGTVSYTYDSDHRVTSRTDAKGNQAAYSYETYGRPFTRQYYAPQQSQTLSLNYDSDDTAAYLWAWFTANSSGGAAHSCQLYFDLNAWQVNLLNDAGTGWTQGNAGGSGSVSNSQCSINLAQTTVNWVGPYNTIYLVLAITYTGATQIPISLAITDDSGFGGWWGGGHWSVLSSAGTQYTAYFYDQCGYDAGSNCVWQNQQGRLAYVSSSTSVPAQGGAIPFGMVSEFAYNAAGRTTWQETSAGINGSQGQAMITTPSYYGYDTQGGLTSAYNSSFTAKFGSLAPQAYALGGSYRFQYDALERLTSMTDSQNNSLATAAYNQANEVTSLWTTYTNATETRTYNSLLQLTRSAVCFTAVGPGQACAMNNSVEEGLMDMQYGYNPGMNNGQVASTTDNIADPIHGETVQYMYDRLQRLVLAQTSSGGTPWGFAYSYDGFGNLTDKNVTQGSVPAVSFQYNPANNQPINQFYGNTNNPPQNNYDANGNAPVGTWDAENHLVQQVLDGATLSWVYDPSGKRVAQFQQMSGYGQWTFYVYGATGQLVGQIGCNLYPNPASSVCAAQRANVYFGGKLIARMEPQSGTLVARGVVADRLGTVRAVQTSGGWSTPTYYPWGEAKTAGGIDGQEQFGTYVRDSTLSSQDYAMQRYYSNNTGRFSSADKGTPDPKIPESWNRYAYVGGDPVNFRDPSGRDCIPVSEDAESRSGRTDAYGPCSVGSYGTGGNDYQCGLVSAFADPTPDPFCYVQPQDVTEGPPPSWIPLEEDRGSGAPFDVLGMLPTAREWLGKFNTKSSSPCGKDLSAIGLSVQTVQSLAKDLGVVFAPATINPQIYAQLQQDGADFGVIVNTKLIYYDQNFFWQNSIQTLMATLIHEFSHVNGFDDLTDEGALGVTSDQAITLKIANDCFGIRQ